MRIAIAALFLMPAFMFTVGSLNAAPVATGLQSLPPSTIKKVACGPNWGLHCGPYHHWVCNSGGDCWCALCDGGGGYYGYSYGWRWRRGGGWHGHHWQGWHRWHGGHHGHYRFRWHHHR